MSDHPHTKGTYYFNTVTLSYTLFDVTNMKKKNISEEKVGKIG